MVSILVRCIALATGDELARAAGGAITPVHVITAAMTVLDTYKNLRGHQKRELLVATIELLSNNADGIDGTADDLIPTEVARVLRDLIRSEMLANIVDHLCALRKTVVPRAWWTKCFGGGGGDDHPTAAPV